MNWKNTLRKAPPIENPRKDREYPNDSMSDDEVEALFEEILDPIIAQWEKNNRSTAQISLVRLGMSPAFAKEKADQFYGDKGYGKIKTDDTTLVIWLS